MSETPAAVAQPIWSRTFGQGPRHVLALHCTIAHSGAWRSLAARLGDDVSMLCPDMLSHGRSPDWDETGDFQDRSVDAVRPLLTAPMDLVGHSFGATIALRLAVAHPDLVRSLTLIEPVFFAVARADDPARLDDHDRDATPFSRAMADGDRALAARLFNRMWSAASPRWPDLPEATRAAMIRGIHVVPACAPALYDDRAGLLRDGALSRAAMPTLVMRGGDSHPVMETVCEGLARRMPDAQSLVIKGGGHMLPISHPKETAEAITGLFARVA